MVGTKNKDTKNLEEKLREVVANKKNERENFVKKNPEKIKDIKKEEVKEKKSELKKEEMPKAEIEPTEKIFNDSNFAFQATTQISNGLSFNEPIIAEVGGRLESGLTDVSTSSEDSRETGKLYNESSKKYESPDDINTLRSWSDTQVKNTNAFPSQQMQRSRMSEFDAPNVQGNPEESYKIENIQRAENASPVMPWEGDRDDSHKKYQRHNF